MNGCWLYQGWGAALVNIWVMDRFALILGPGWSFVDEYGEGVQWRYVDICPTLAGPGSLCTIQAT